jgi:hypothetical protein
MPYFDEDGNEVTGLLTEEEAKSLVEESKKELVEENAKIKAETDAKIAEATKNVEDLKAKIDAAAAAPAGGAGEQSQGDKEQNLVKLREKLEAQETAIKQEREQMSARISALEGDKVEQAIAAVAAGNKELAEKIRYNYDKVLSGVQATTAEEIAAKVQNAVKLSGGPATPNPLDKVIGGGAATGGGVKSPAGKVEFKPAEVEIGGKLGITDADREKYGNDPRLTNMNTK